MHTVKSYWILSLTVLLLITGPSLSAAEKKPDKSIEEKTKIHRLNTKQRSAYDAFAYVNRIPPKAEEEESPQTKCRRRRQSQNGTPSPASSRVSPKR